MVASKVWVIKQGQKKDDSPALLGKPSKLVAMEPLKIVENESMIPNAAIRSLEKGSTSTGNRFVVLEDEQQDANDDDDDTLESLKNMATDNDEVYSKVIWATALKAVDLLDTIKPKSRTK
ncbi:hypothetical protein PTKIN_Ptkin09bG0203100 [Pterospermum kingtungense]